jgi:3-hydroxypropanoate dehydrogenase
VLSGGGMTGQLDGAGIELLFTNARTHRSWTAERVEPDLLRRAWDLARMGPTSANCSPLRIVFVASSEAKARLRPALDPGNVDKTMTAPVTAIFAWDMRFYELMGKLAPRLDANEVFAGKAELILETAQRNGTLQAAYFILAARALGLDAGPMSGFDRAMVDREFFPDGRYRSNFLCNLGHGDPTRLHPRAARLEFEEACQLL